MRIWLPYADWPDALDLPAGVQADVFDGSGDAAGQLGEVELFVLPYLAGTGPARLMADMPSLRVAQTLTAGVDDVRPLVPDGVDAVQRPGRARRVDRRARGGPRRWPRCAGIPDHVRAAERGVWAHDTRPSLADRRVLIVGLRRGRRRRSSARLAGFECEVRRVARRRADR